MSEYSQQHEVHFRDSKGSALEGAIFVHVEEAIEEGFRKRTCEVRIELPQRVVEAQHENVYHAFQKARQKLEPAGLLPVCWGACADVQVSAMAVDMSDGIRAYRMSTAPEDGLPELVSIFESGSETVPAPVAEQIEYSRRMFEPSE